MERKRAAQLPNATPVLQSRRHKTYLEETIMQRREFAKKTLTAIAATSILGTVAKAQSQNKSPYNASDEEILNQSSPFKCKFAANYYGGLCFNAMKNCKTFEDKIQYYYDHGIRAIEDNNMLSRPVEVQEAIAKKMSQLGMEMGVFSSYGGMKFQMTANKLDPKKSPDKAASIEVTKQKMKDAVECAKRVNAKWITLVPGYIDPSFETSYQMANVAEHLKVAADICGKAGKTIVLEPLSFTAHPGLWLQKASDAYMLCKAVNNQYCKILFDVFHQQNTEGSLIRNIDAAWDEIAYFHLGDTPGRNEPFSGEINFVNVIKHIHEKGYRGLYGMEHGMSDKSEAGEAKLWRAYRKIDAAIA